MLHALQSTVERPHGEAGCSARSPPATAGYRISPLDSTDDNLTACGLDVDCVEAAVVSGQLAAHAIAQQPALADITGYDHP